MKLKYQNFIFFIFTLFIVLFQVSAFAEFSLQISQPDSTPQASPLKLTEEEQAWLKAHPEISVAVKHGYSPIEFIFELKEFRGISIDYLKKIETLLGVHFAKTMANQELAANNADMVSAITSPSMVEGTRYTALSVPFLVSPIAAFTKKGVPKYEDIERLYGKKVAVFKSGFIAKKLAQEHPEIDLYLVDIAEEAIEAVLSGKVDAYIGNAVIIKYVLKSSDNENIEFNFNTPYNSEIYFAVRSDWPLLKSILEKSLGAISKEDQTYILDKWTNVQYSEKINYELIGLITSVSLILLSIFYISNRRLKGEVQRRVTLESSLIRAKVSAEQAELTIRQYSRELERLAMVAKHTSDAVVITDAEGKTVWVNQAFTKLTGYSLEEMQRKKPGSLLQGKETDPEAIRRLREAVEHFRDIEIDLVNYRKDGQPYWVNIKIVAIVNSFGERRFIAIQTDITRQVNYINTIKNHQEDMDALFALIPDGVVVLDGEGHISHVNPAFLSMTGLNGEVLLGLTEQHLDSLLQQLCVEPEEYRSIDAFSKTTNRLNNQYIGVDGFNKQDFKFQINGPTQKVLERSCIEPNQKRISRVIYFKDVTQEVRLENMKSEFITTAAHELRTPMSVILGYAELLKTRAFQADVRTEMVEAIHNKSEMVASLLDDLLDVAVIEHRAEKTLKLEKHAFAPFIQSIADTFIFASNPNRVQLADIPSIPDFYFDSQRLERAINNCLTNAYKFSPPDGKVAIRVSTSDGASSELVIAIEDHGIGMNPEQLARIFEKFYRADKSGHIPGTGLGMVLVKDIVEAHGGRVEVESEPNVGTTVRLVLPIRTTMH